VRPCSLIVSTHSYAPTKKVVAWDVPIHEPTHKRLERHVEGRGEVQIGKWCLLLDLLIRHPLPIFLCLHFMLLL